MSAVLALRAAQAVGAHITVRDGQLHIMSDGPLPDEVLADLRTYRDQLVGMLLEPSPSSRSCSRLADLVGSSSLGRPHSGRRRTCSSDKSARRREYQLLSRQGEPDGVDRIGSGGPQAGRGSR